MKFQIENCSDDSRKLRKIEGITEVQKTYNSAYTQSYFYKEFNTLEEIMEFSKNQKHDLIIETEHTEGIVGEKIDGTIKIYDYWNE